MMVTSSRDRRIAAYLAIAIAIAVVAFVILRGDGTYTVTASFENAGQLVNRSDVTVGGDSVGKVTDIILTPDNRAKIVMEINRPDLTPFHVGTTATIRAVSLAGVANRLVELRLGPNNAPSIPEGGALRVENTKAPVDLDELINALDPKTLKGLQSVVRGFADQWRDDPATLINESTYANKGIRNLSPALAAWAEVTAELSRDEQTLAGFLDEASRTVQIVATRRDDLTDLVSNANTAARAFAAQSAALDRAFAVLPDVMRRGAATLAEFRGMLDDFDAFIDEAEPATRDLAPFLAELRTLLVRAEPTMRDLSRMIRESGKYNDLTDLFDNQKLVTKKAEKTFPRAISGMRSGEPILDFLRPYVPEFTAWVSHFATIAGSYDANGHYARAQVAFGAFSTAPNPGFLTAIADPLSEFEHGQVRRCPGGAIQPAGDGSNPFLDTGADCDPATGLP